MPIIQDASGMNVSAPFDSQTQYLSCNTCPFLSKCLLDCLLDSDACLFFLCFLKQRDQPLQLFDVRYSLGFAAQGLSLHVQAGSPQSLVEDNIGQYGTGGTQCKMELH